MPINVAYIIGGIIALGGTIAAFIMIVPDKKRPTLNKFFKWLHDFFNFKSLWLEKILKFLYINATLSCIAVGFFMLFSGYESYSYSSYSSHSHSSFQSFAGYGVLLMFLGPVIVRIFYEFLMLIILLVKNATDINNKLVAQDGSVADRAEKEEQAAATLPQQQYTAQQPQQYTAQQPQQYTAQQPQQYTAQQPQQYTAQQPQQYTAQQPQQFDNTNTPNNTQQ